MFRKEHIKEINVNGIKRNIFTNNEKNPLIRGALEGVIGSQELKSSKSGEMDKKEDIKKVRSND